VNKRLGMAGIILLMIAIGIWVALPKRSSSPGSGASGLATNIPAPEAQLQRADDPTKPLAGSDPWTRPSAKVAARNLRRVKFSGLKRFGASEQLVNRLTDGDILAVIQDLNQQAQRGDQSAANMLEYMARLHCAFARNNPQRSESRTPEFLDAQALPEADAEWIRTAIQEQKASDEQLVAACVSIDSKEVEGWVAKAADHGNAASLYLRWVFRGNQSAALSQQQLQQAVDAGYPEAQAWVAQGLTTGAPRLPRGGESSETLFKEAADSLPYAESLLAVCEFKGCPGVEADIPSAIAHAREAAQRGSFDAMIEIGPQLQASQIDPDEVAAWNLVGAMLAQQGCSYGGLTVQGMTSATNTLASKSISGKARALADQYWHDYGPQMMSNIGCSQ
jgi:hypothetical protein